MPYMMQKLMFFPMALYQLLTRRMPGREWWHRVDEHVLIGALPFAHNVPVLLGQGVSATINLCNEYKGPLGRYRAHGIEQLYVPVQDFTTPSLTMVRECMAFIEAQKEQGGQVYVHCKAGRGRSATIVLCYLIAAYELTPEAAQSRLSELRPRVVSQLWQRDVVQEWAREVAEGPA